MASRFEWYDDWRGLASVCDGCGWHGTYAECSREPYQALLDLECPRCFERLAVVSYPSDVEVEEAAARGHPEAVAELPNRRERQRSRAAFEASKLVRPEQLPDLEDDALVFAFDSEKREGKGGRDYVVSSAGREVWREPAHWEDWARFNEIVEVLKARYGARFRSLEPTETAVVSLLGDDWTAAGKLESR